MTWIGIVALAGGLSLGQNAPSDQKADLVQLSKMVHSILVKEVPKQVTDASGWGQTIPIPMERLILPRLRVTVKVGDRLELPHGLWRKIHLMIPEPERDVAVAVTDLKMEAGKPAKVSLDLSARVHSEMEFQHWQKGLATIGGVARATALVDVHIDCEVNLSLDTKKFPPEVKVEPKVTDSRIDVREFELLRPREGPAGDRARSINELLRSGLQALAQSQEPQIREQANQAIAQALRDGKGTLSATSLWSVFQGKKAP